jgi:hypothetical protein
VYVPIMVVPMNRILFNPKRLLDYALVTFTSDPRRDLEALARPAAVVRSGVRLI